MKTRTTNKRSKRAADVAIIGITLAIIILLQLFAALLQKIGMPMSLALGLIPVLVVSQTHGMKYGAISGGFFGLITLVFSVIYAGAIPIYSVTINPLVSVFPRIAVGIVCSLSFFGFMRIARKRNSNSSIKKQKLAMFGISATSTVFGILTNTVLFLGMFFAFAHGKSFDGVTIDLKWILASIVALNTVIELVLFTVLVPPIVYALTQSKLSLKLHLNGIYDKDIVEDDGQDSEDTAISDDDDENDESKQ